LEKTTPHDGSLPWKPLFGVTWRTR
jgi:hypothetical protein